MKTFLTLYVIGVVIFLSIDLLWLGVLARDYYRDGMGALLLERPRMDIGLIFYMIFVVGLVIFGMRAGLAANDWSQAALYGALFGFFCYATYDLTNLAILKGFPLHLALVDMAWGTVLSGVTSALAFVIARAWLGDMTG